MAETRLSIRCDAEELARWQAAADAAGQTFSAWVRDVLNIEESRVKQGKLGIREMATRYDTALELVREDRPIPAEFVRTVLGGGLNKG